MSKECCATFIATFLQHFANETQIHPKRASEVLLNKTDRFIFLSDPQALPSGA
jgi:hypothetical protein